MSETGEAPSTRQQEVKSPGLLKRVWHGLHRAQPVSESSTPEAITTNKTSIAENVAPQPAPEAPVTPGFLGRLQAVASTELATEQTGDPPVESVTVTPARPKLDNLDLSSGPQTPAERMREHSTVPVSKSTGEMPGFISPPNAAATGTFVSHEKVA